MFSEFSTYHFEMEWLKFYVLMDEICWNLDDVLSKFQACLEEANKEKYENKCKTWKLVPLTRCILDIHCHESIHLDSCLSFCQIISLLGHEGLIWRIHKIISMFHTLFPLCYYIFHGIITMLRMCWTLLN